MKNKRGKDIAIGSDHAGYDLKKLIMAYLLKQGHNVIDMGTRGRKSVNYPAFGKAVAEAVDKGEVPLGILICGTGIGMSITANRYQNVRAALAHDSYTARMAKAHNNANILVLGARVIGQDVAQEAVEVWLKTKFEGGRHQDRLDMIGQGC